jgi:plastocyanin
MKHLAAIALIATLSILTGCKHSAPSTPATITQIDPATAGTVTGTIHFAGTAPKRIPIDMSQDPVCTFSHTENLTEQYVVNNGDLANVYVYIKDGLGNRIYAAPAAPVVMDQKNCRYIPHVIAVMAGQPVEFRTSDNTMHNVHILPQESGNQSSDVSQGPMGAPERRTFKSPEAMIEVRCNNHPWMSAFINVAANPFYAVSDAEGHFQITGLPPGNYTLAAVQEKLPEQTATITVAPHQTTTASFTFAVK